MNESNFKRHKSFKNYTSVPNELIRSPLGNAAFRLLCYLGSHSENWVIYQNEIKKTLDWGERKLRSAINELIKKKYLITTQNKNEMGKFMPVNYEFSFEPINSNNFTVTTFSVDGRSVDGESTSKNNNIKENQSKEEQGSVPFPSSNEDVRRHCTTVHCESVPHKNLNEEKEKKASSLFGSSLSSLDEEFLQKKEYLECIKIPNLRDDSIDFFSRKFTLEKLKDCYIKLKKIKNPRNPAALYRMLLEDSLVGIPGMKGESNKSFFYKFIEENDIHHISCKGNYIFNCETGNEISLEIDCKTFQRQLFNWVCS